MNTTAARILATLAASSAPVHSTLLGDRDVVRELDHSGYINIVFNRGYVLTAKGRMALGN